MVLHSKPHGLEVVPKEERNAGPDWPLRLPQAAHTLEAEAFRWNCKLDGRQHGLKGHSMGKEVIPGGGGGYAFISYGFP